ncbi:MAG: DUF5615 family PIN-like protein [Rhizomicrobium sp.]
MRFLVDAQFPPQLAIALRKAGHEAEHVFDIGMVRTPDIEIWHHAERVGAAILSKDSDFVSLCLRATKGPAVVWVRLGNVTNDALEGTVLGHLTEIVAALKAGETLIELT